MLGVGGYLVKPQLAHGQQLSGEVLSRVFTQRTIWLLPIQSLLPDDISHKESFETVFVKDEDGVDDIDAVDEYQTLAHGLRERREQREVQEDTNLNSGSNTKDGGDQQALFSVESQVKNMFPNLPEEVISEALTSSPSLQHAIDNLLDRQETAESGQDEKLTLQTVLQRLSNKCLIEDSNHVLEVNRSSLWRCVLIFYKQAMVNPNVLRKKLTVVFEGEEGVDAGALRAEFFAEALKEMDKRLFEGSDRRRVPKKPWQGGPGHKIAGVLLGHSLLQNGPGYSCLAPCIYAYLTTGNEEAALHQFPSKDDIPLNAATSSLVDCICKIDTAGSDEELDQLLLQNDSYMEIINCSGWPVTECINTKNKASLLQQLLLDELILKRKAALDEIRQGLDISGVLQTICDHKEIFKEVFQYQADSLITYEQVKDMVLNTSPRPKDYPENQAFDFFMDYISDPTNTGKLGSLLTFSTGYSSMPPMGLPFKLTLEYLADNEMKTLPEAHSCFGILQLPVVHSSKQDFFNALNTALEFGAKGFDKF